MHGVALNREEDTVHIVARAVEELPIVFHQNGFSVVLARLSTPGSRLVGFGPAYVNNNLYTRYSAYFSWSRGRCALLSFADFRLRWYGQPRTILGQSR